MKKTNCFKFFFLLMSMLGYMISQPLTTYAQAECYDSQGCSDYSNFGYNSTIASTLEYDNYISSFHSTVVRDMDGSLKIWGEYTKADGISSWLLPTPINAGNYPGMTGKPLKVAIGSASVTNVQFILLTDDNKLWVWGKPGVVISSTLVPGSAFQQLSLGLPAGVTAADVKMMIANYQNLVLTTCSGNVYILTQYWGNVGDGTTTTINTWCKVKKSTGGDLTGIIATRGVNGTFLSLDNAGNLWSWGARVWDGVNTAPATRNSAVPVSLPTTASGNIKMIGVTGSTNNSRATLYVLYENGNLYALGDNAVRQLGNWTTTNSPTWVQPRYNSATGPIMNNIKWISPQENDNLYASINVITSDKKVFNWGQEDKSFLGRGASDCSSGTASVNPGEPIGFTPGYSNSGIIAVETGGHTTMVLKECEGNFGYIGHRINGSMGDNSTEDECDAIFHFNTSAIQVCGAQTVTATLEPSFFGPYCVGNTITFSANPAGGTFSIDPSSTATGTFSGDSLTFTSAGTLRVNYTVAGGSGCGTVTINQLLNIDNCGSSITIPGKIWNDENHNATVDAGEMGIGNGFWANIVDPDGLVIASVKVGEDGTYTFNLGEGAFSKSGNYAVILTNDSKDPGDLLSTADTPQDGYMYTGVNRGSGDIDPANKTGKVDVGDLSAVSGGTHLDDVNFGISNIALPVTFGKISAWIKDGSFNLSWSTLKEKNNDHFEIEASTDGKKFVKIAEVKSKAATGNSDTPTDYNFQESTSGIIVGALSLLTLFMGVLIHNRRNRIVGILIMAAIIGLVNGCSKKNINEIDMENGSLYIRIVQVDKDGARSYSEVVKVIKK